MCSGCRRRSGRADCGCRSRRRSSRGGQWSCGSRCRDSGARLEVPSQVAVTGDRGRAGRRAGRAGDRVPRADAGDAGLHRRLCARTSGPAAPALIWPPTRNRAIRPPPRRRPIRSPCAQRRAGAAGGAGTAGRGAAAAPSGSTRQHRAGKLTARERSTLLCDPGTLHRDRQVRHPPLAPTSAWPSRRSRATAWSPATALVHGRQIFVFAQDFTVFGGSLSEAYAGKICKIMDLATTVGAPVVGLNDSGGARIQEGVASLGGYAEIFLRNTLASGVVPQLSAVMGPCAGGAVYSPAITDFIFMVESTSHMFITGPDVIKTVTHEEVSKEELGGAPTHAAPLGRGPPALRRRARLPAGAARAAVVPAPEQPGGPARARPSRATGPTARTPRWTASSRTDPAKPYDMRELLKRVVDDGDFFEIQPEHALNIIVGFARLDGRPVGVVANQPAHLAGCLDIDASVKAARFVRFCDCFNIPLVHLRRRARVPARHRPGVRRHHPARGQAAVRVRRGHGAQADGDHAQGVRRGVRRHGVQAHPRRHQLRLPDRRDRGDGPRGRGQHHLPRRARERRPTRPRRARATCASTARSSPTRSRPRRWATSTRSSGRARRAPRLCRALALLANKRQERPPRKHGNIPL